MKGGVSSSVGHSKWKGLSEIQLIFVDFGKKGKNLRL